MHQLSLILKRLDKGQHIYLKIKIEDPSKSKQNIKLDQMNFNEYNIFYPKHKTLFANFCIKLAKDIMEMGKNG